MTRLAYPLPEIAYPDNRLCVQLFIPDEPQHIEAFLGQIEALSKWYNWQRDDEKRGASVAIIWKEIFEETLETIYQDICSSEEAFPMLRQAPNKPCTMEYKDINGQWIPFFDFSLCNLFTGSSTILEYTETNNSTVIYQNETTDYEANPNNYQPQVDVNAQSVANRDKLLCYALRNIIGTYLEICARDAENVARGGVLLSTILSAGAVIAFAPISSVVASLMLGSLAVGGITGALSVQPSEYRDEQAIDEVICHAYNYLKGDLLSRTNVAGTFNSVPFTQDSIAYRMSAVLGGLFNRTQTYLAIVNIMMEKIGGVDGLVNECDGCGNVDWSHTFTFEESEGWYAETHTQPNNLTSGVLSSGQWVATDGNVGGRFRRAILLRRDFSQTTITSITVNCPYTKGVFDQNIASHLILVRATINSTDITAKQILASSANDATDSVSWTGVLTASTIRIHLASSHRFTQNYSGYASIDGITVTGRGVNPFV